MYSSNVGLREWIETQIVVMSLNSVHKWFVLLVFENINHQSLLQSDSLRQKIDLQSSFCNDKTHFPNLPELTY